MDRKVFAEACRKVIEREHVRDGIGTLGEKTLHAVLKRCFEPHEENHEIKVGGFVADIVGEDGIIEIQTGNFSHLRKKLAAFLECAPVTVVYPMSRTKWIMWVDEETGAVAEKRKSPKSSKPIDAFCQLYYIKEFLSHPNFRLKLIFLETEEYRRLNGWGRDKKNRAEKCDIIPTGIVEEIEISSLGDYGQFIPKGLPEKFTAKEYAKCARVQLKAAQRAVNVLCSLGVIAYEGKRGNAFLYSNKKALPN